MPPRLGTEKIWKDMGRPGNSIYFLGWAWYDVAWGEDEEINALALGRFVNISKLWIRQYQP